MKLPRRLPLPHAHNLHRHLPRRLLDLLRHNTDQITTRVTHRQELPSAVLLHFTGDLVAAEFTEFVFVADLFVPIMCVVSMIYPISPGRVEFIWLHEDGVGGRMGLHTVILFPSLFTTKAQIHFPSGARSLK